MIEQHLNNIYMQYKVSNIIHHCKYSQITQTY